jgi:hypothetical protein
MSRTGRAFQRAVAGVGISAFVLGGLAVVAAPPAAAATSVSLTGVAANGQIGVPQNIVITASVDGGACGSILSPAATVFSTVSGPAQAVGTATFSRCVGNAFQYTFQWLPAATGVFYITASVADGSSNAVRSAITAVPTTTRITLANTVTLGQPTPVTASVTANNGSLASPQGSIQFSILGGGNIGGPIPLNNAVPSTTQLQWTPAVLGAASLIATYIPSSTNFTCGSTCVSAPDSTQVTSTGVQMYLANPPDASAGSPTTLTAVVSVVPPSGTVRFTINGSNIGVVGVQGNGQAQVSWTPPGVGTFAIGAYWNGAGNLSAAATDTITVGTAPAQSDQIRVVTADGTVLTPGASYTSGNGTTITFTATTASGAPVTFAVSGPCTLTGNTFSVNRGNGQCRVTASSVGGNGYGPTTATVTVNLIPGRQTPRGTIRASGNIPRNTNITLATRANNVTNAGQTMRWRVTSGTNVCRISYPSNGSVRLRANRSGSCNVRATAPAVSGQWNSMTVNRTYRAR